MKKWLKYCSFILLTILSVSKICNAEIKDQIEEKYTAIPDVYIWKVDKSGQRVATSHQMTMHTRKSNNQFVYCIEPGTTIDGTAMYTGYDSNQAYVANMTPEQWNRIMLLAYYGYKYVDSEVDHSDIKWYAVAQYMIWQVVPNGYDIYFSSDVYENHRIEKFTNEMAEMERLLSEHEVVPNFGTSVNVALNGSKTITDQNHVLDKFKVSTNNNNVTVSKKANTLELFGNTVGNTTVTLTKSDVTYGHAPIVYQHPTSQNVVEVGSYTPVSTTLKVNVIGGTIQLTKYDQDTKKCQAQPGGKLEGTQYKLYKTDGTYMRTLVIGKNCTTTAVNIKVGSYYLQESVPGQNYELDTKQYPIEVTEDKLNVRLTVYDKMYLGEIELKKVDKNTNSCTPTGNATLQNAVYGIYNESDNTLVKQITINESCTAKSGKILPKGNYYIQEIKAPKGYKIDTTKYHFEVTKENANTKIEITVADEVITTELTINKQYVSEQGLMPEQGAIFDIYSKTTNQKVGSLTIGSDGKASITLPYDDYLIVQTFGKKDYKKSENISFSVNEQTEEKSSINLVNEPYKAKLHVQKIDKETNNPIPIANIEFKLYDKINKKFVCETEDCIYKTNEAGEFTTKELYPSTYELIELQQLIKGYISNTEPYEFVIDEFSKDTIEVLFANEPVKGRLELLKTGEQPVFMAKLVYAEIPLKDIEFEVYAAEDITSGGKKYYSKNELITKIRTDENGLATLDNLPFGSYYLEEITKLEHYIENNKKYYFTFGQSDIKNKVFTTEIHVHNSLKKGALRIIKIDSETKKQINGAIFKLYTEQGELVDVIDTYEDNDIYINFLPAGKYYVIESEPPIGYVLNPEKMYFEIKENDEEVKVYIENSKIKGSIEVTKKDEKTNENLANATLGVYDEHDELVAEGLTDSKGKLLVENLEYGTYYVKENKAPSGYKLNEQKYFFKINEDEQIIRISVPNTSSYQNSNAESGILNIYLYDEKKKRV